MNCDKARSPVSSTHRANAILKTAIATSAVRRAAASPWPRWCNVSASAADQAASLINSRSRSSGVAAMIAARWRARARRSWSGAADRLEARGDRLEGRQGRGRAGDGAHEEVLQVLGTLGREQHLAFVGEVAEERALRDARPLGDLRDGGAVEPALAVEREGRPLKPATTVSLPSTHALSLPVFSRSRQQLS